MGDTLVSPVELITVDPIAAGEGFIGQLAPSLLDALRAAGVPTDAVTIDGVSRAYLEGLIFCAATFRAALLTIDPANERGVALLDALVVRTFAAVDDLDAGAAIGLDRS